MNNRLDKKYNCMSYLEFYKQRIAPVLREADLLVRTCEDYVSADEAARALDISVTEVEDIMSAKNISQIDQHTFFSIMKSGSSLVCKLYRREIECGSPIVYSREDISYIYDMNISTVNDICDKMGITQITSSTLQKIMENVPVFVTAE